MNEIISDINKKISVIIPYSDNTSYFERCLCSFTRQSFKSFRIYLPKRNFSEKALTISEKYKEKMIISSDFEDISDIIKNTSDEYIMFISPEATFSMNFIERMVNQQNEYPDSFISCGYELAEEKCNNISLGNIYGKLYITSVLKSSELISYNENAFTSFIFNMKYMALSECRFRKANISLYDAFPEKYLADFDYDFKNELMLFPEKEDEIRKSLKEKWEKILIEFFSNSEFLSEIIFSESKYSSIDCSQFVEITKLLLKETQAEKNIYLDIISKLIHKSVELEALGLYSFTLEKFILPEYKKLISKTSFTSYDEKIFAYICQVAEFIQKNEKNEYNDIFLAMFELTEKQSEYLLKSNLHDFCIYCHKTGKSANLSTDHLTLPKNEVSEIDTNLQNQELLNEIEKMFIKNMNNAINSIPAKSVVTDFSMNGIISAFSDGRLGFSAAFKCVSACFKYRFSRK